MTDGKRILIIDDDDVLADTLSEHLEAHEGCACTISPTGVDGLQTALNTYFDLIVLDMQIADLKALEMCKRLRSADVMTPIIMLSTVDDDDVTISSLDAGATDCVVKPFKLGVLTARIRAHIRQFEHSDQAVLNIGPFEFRPGAKALYTAGQADKPIRLTDKEVQILKYLYLHENRTVSRDEILGEVWGYNGGVTTHTLETHIYRLRQKMDFESAQDNSTQNEILRTEPGGYRLSL